jgi:glycosyltransferase involved in cell wall biosynthesis
MNKKVAILTPTYGRPHKIQSYIDNIRSVTNMDLAEIVFIVEDDDLEVKKLCQESGEKTFINTRARSFGGAMNTAVRLLDNQYFFGSSDDFFFHPNWLEPLLELTEKYGFIKCNDLGRTDNLATCYLINRSYLTRCVPDSPEDIVCEKYLHNFTDTELTAVAIANGEYYYCQESIVEHMHPVWGKAEYDATYGLQNGTWQYDENIFYERSSFWMDYEKNELKDLR